MTNVFVLIELAAIVFSVLVGIVFGVLICKIVSRKAANK